MLLWHLSLDPGGLLQNQEDMRCHPSPQGAVSWMDKQMEDLVTMDPKFPGSLGRGPWRPFNLIQWSSSLLPLCFPSVLFIYLLSRANHFPWNLIHNPRYSVAELCPTLHDPMDCSMPGFLVLYNLPEFAQTHVHWVSGTIQSSLPLLPPSPPALNLSQHQGLF